jgi:hypothetical protein
MRGWPQFKSLIENQTRSDVKRIVGSPPIFRNEMEFLPLQAADLYAWQVRNHYVENHRVENQTIEIPPNRVLRSLGTMPSIFRHYDEPEFQRLQAHLLRIGEQFAQDHPDVPLIPIGDDKTERKRARRRGRKNG